MGILPLTAILVASEAFVASKRPRRSRLTSKLNSVTSVTYVPMLLWPVNAFLRWLRQTTDGQLWSIDLRASPQVKMWSEVKGSEDVWRKSQWKHRKGRSAPLKPRLPRPTPLSAISLWRWYVIPVVIVFGRRLSLLVAHSFPCIAFTLHFASLWGWWLRNRLDL